MTVNPILAQFASEPSLVAPEMLSRFEANLHALVAHEDFAKLSTDQAAASGDNFWFAADDYRARFRPYIVQDGVLQIPVKGVLLNGFPWAFGNLATGYEYIWRAFERGCADYLAGNIKGIALVEDSPGGMVAGCFDTCDKMSAAKEATGVPVRAFAHESAYSAAYALFTVGDKGVVSRTGGVGSIGVVTMHVDFSKALDESGIKVTYIFAGKHKVDGNPYEPLPEDVRARIQARIDELYGVFVSTVARNRGLDEKAVRETEALTFTATQAVSNGLADSIGSLDDAVAAFVADLSSTSGDDEMSDKGNQTAVDQAAVDAARAEGVAEGERNAATAAAEARQAERARVAAITGCDEAKGRTTLATHIAMNTEMSVDEAKAMLTASAKEGSTTVETPFAKVMEQNENQPGVGDGGNGGESGQGDDLDPIALARGVGLACVRPASK